MRASRMEILGSWLHIWTPPRDVEIPPVPWRAVALLAAFAVVLVIVGLIVVVPALDDAKARRSAAEQRAHAAHVRRERARLTEDQRPRRARAPQVARLHAAGRDGAARAALLAAARASIARDADARMAAGTLDGPGVREVRCRYLPGATSARVGLDCLVVTTATSRLAIGQPFLVAGTLRDGRYAWCHTNPRPAEGSLGRDIAVPIPAACKG